MVLEALVISAALSTISMASETIYSHDTLGRVITVSSTNGTHVEYQYDAAGNRIQKVVTASPVTTGKFMVLPLSGYVVIPVP